MKMLDAPRTISPAETFNALVSWFHDEMIIRKKAPGVLIGISGTDSLVTFLIASKAFEMAGKPERVLGVHFAPSEDFIYDHPEAAVHLWFANEVIPWLRRQAPNAKIMVDTSIDWRCDGLRWGSLMDRSVVSNEKTRRMLVPEEQYWVVGTRNLTEDVLLNYSNASKAVSLQPLIHLWKSEILQLSEHLGIPKIAITKSCETDCICGRMRLPAEHILEVDALLMVKRREVYETYVQNTIPIDLRRQLNSFIDSQINKGQFKNNVPYSPEPYVFAFESGFIDLKGFNHFGHLYIAFQYLKEYSFDESFERYMKYLKIILDSAGQSHRLNLDLTKKYFVHLDKIMKDYPNYDCFEELAEAIPSVLHKISA